MTTELEWRKERLGTINHQLALCMREQEILEKERQKEITMIRILEPSTISVQRIQDPNKDQDEER